MSTRVFFLYLVLWPLVAVAEEKAACPLALPKETVALTPPAGWRGYSSSLMRLTGFGMMAGPPESMTYLIPYNTQKRKDGSTSKWIFERGDEKWMYCTYDGSAAIQISKRLGDAAIECQISHKTDRWKAITTMEAICR